MKQESKAQSDGVDNAIDYVYKNSAKFLRYGPPAIGFLLFLIYFCQNNFFPSFDVFSLTSLLLAAFIIGLLAYLVLAFGIAAPGYFWFDTFVKDRHVKEDLEYSDKWRVSCKDNRNMRDFGRIYFFLPLLFSNLFFLWVATTSYVDGALRAFVSIVVPVALCVGAAVELKKIYRFSFGNTAKYVLATLFSIFISSVVNIIVIIMVVKAHAGTADDSIQMFVGVVATILLSVVFFISAIAGLTSYKYTLFFSALFAILFSLIVGAWATLPKNIVKLLGVGNYVASEVVLTGSACREISNVLREIVDSDCVIKDVKIIWSLGEMHRLEVSRDSSPVVVSIPSSSVSAVLISSNEK